jgi:short-subunit dehydrogenase
MVAYGATKAFDMVFTEGLWTEVHDKGVDVLGLLLGKTDTPALRTLEYSRGQIPSMDDVPPGAVSAESVVDEAFDNLVNGPTLMVGDMMRMAAEVFKTLTRNEAVNMVVQASAASMGTAQLPEDN